MRSQRSVLLTEYCLDDSIEKNEMGGECSVWRRVEVYTGFWWGNLRERDCLKEPSIDGDGFKWLFKRWNVGVWIGLFWLGVGTGGGLL
jgi:hypothetical protein